MPVYTANPELVKGDWFYHKRGALKGAQNGPAHHQSTLLILSSNLPKTQILCVMAEGGGSIQICLKPKFLKSIWGGGGSFCCDQKYLAYNFCFDHEQI